MAARKRAAKKPTKAKKAAEEEIDELHLELEEGFFDDMDDEDQATTIEAMVTVDSIEYVEDEEDPAAEPVYRVNLHAELAEHIAQHLFAEHVQEGRISIEFQPADPKLRKRNTLVRR